MVTVFCLDFGVVYGCLGVLAWVALNLVLFML